MGKRFEAMGLATVSQFTAVAHFSVCRLRSLCLRANVEIILQLKVRGSADSSYCPQPQGEAGSRDK